MLINNVSLLLVLLFLLIIATFSDLRFQKIPNWLTFSAIILALSSNTVINGQSGFLFSLKGLAMGIGLLIPFYIIRGMGAGDVKLMGAVGSFLGTKHVFVAFLMTALAGGVYALVALASKKNLADALKRYWFIIKSFLLMGKLTYVPPKEMEKMFRLRYGVAIATGTIVSVLMRDRLNNFLNF